MAKAWSNIQVALIVANYLNMLNKDLRREPVNKTDHRNNIKPLLANISDGSIEFKHQNISAVMIKLGLPYIKGYRPRWNYQSILEDEVISVIKNQRLQLEQTFSVFADAAPDSVPSTDFSKVVDIAPERTTLSEPEVRYERKPIKINYVEREQRNSSLGLKGEEFILEYEKWRLINEGKENLAEKIEWISKTNDGAGFDILSRNVNGTDRYIEVKTTKLTKETPIFFTKNEFEFSQQKKESYHLYRLFNFNNNPRLFCVNGDFDSFCRKEATSFKGYI